MGDRVSLAGLCAVMGGSGVLHFVVPRPYLQIVPAPLRGRAAAVVALSGACELACAMLLLLPRKRPLGAYATAALLVAVFPANVQMAIDAGKATPAASARRRIATWLRLPLQVPLILWALRFRHPGAR